MAQHTYRYSLTSLNNDELQAHVPGAPSLDSRAPNTLCDITLDSAYLADLSDFMLSQGYTLTATDPPLSTALTFAASLASPFTGASRTVRLATTVNITSLVGSFAVDGLFVTNGDRVLVKNQNTASQNGIYTVSGGSWSFAADWTTGTVVPELQVYVSEGNTQAHSVWGLQTTGSISVGGTALTFVNVTAAVDTTAAHLAGTETFTGSKTFSTAIKSGAPQAAGGATFPSTTSNAVELLTNQRLALGTNWYVQESGDLFDIYRAGTLYFRFNPGVDTFIQGPVFKAAGTVRWSNTTTGGLFDDGSAQSTLSAPTSRAMAVASSLGVGASDVITKFGTSVADGSVNVGAKLFSARTGIGSGASEVEKAYVTADGTFSASRLKPTMSPVIGASRVVRLISVSNIANLSNAGSALDGVTIATGDRILLAGQSTASQNGIYVATVTATAALALAQDWSTGAVVPEMKVYVSEGTTYSHSTWNLTTQGVISVGSTGLAFDNVSYGSGVLGGDLQGTLPNPTLAPAVYATNPYRQVRAASTANIVIASWGGAAIDGLGMSPGERVLLKDQTTQSQNGIYVCVAGTSLVRATDFVTGAVTPEMIIQVADGATQANSEWRLTTTGSITVGTTALVFENCSTFDYNHIVKYARYNTMTLSGTGTAVDGGTLAVGDRVLYTGDSGGYTNGIWIVQSGAWTRPGDWVQGRVFLGTSVWVTHGTAYASTLWKVTTAVQIPVVPGTTQIYFTNVAVSTYDSTSDLSGSLAAAPVISTTQRPLLGNLHVVRVLRSTNIATPLTQNLATAIDGITLAEGDRVLLTAQTDATQNGIWTAKAAGWVRPYDFPAFSTGSVLAECEVAVSEGTAWGHTYWVLSTPGLITVNGTSLTFIQKPVTVPGAAMPLLGTSRIVTVASTANVASLSGTLTIDGVQPLDGARVLIKNQTTQSQNGIYIANNSGAWTRATDWVTGAVIPEARVYVTAGSTQTHTEWYVSSFTGGIVGTHNCVFTQNSYLYATSSLVGDVTGTPGATVVPTLVRSQSGNLIPVSAVSTSNLTTYYGPQTIDGVALANGDRYLLTAQSTASQNGIWTVSGASSVRMFSGYTLYPGTRVFIQGGTAKAQTEWVLTDAPASNGFIDGSTATQTWTQITKTAVAPAALGSSTGSPGTAIQLSPRDHVHAITYGTTANTVAQGNDSRFFSAAGGDLTGTYPNPTLATSVRLNSGAMRLARVASTANVPTRSGLLVIDGVTTVAGDRVLLKNQTTGSENGIWTVAAGAWSLAVDWATGLVSGEILIAVSEGTTQAHTDWTITNQGTITVGTTALTVAGVSATATGAAGGVLSGTYPNPAFDAAYAATAATPAALAAITGVVGTSTNYARADHAHALTYGTTAATVAQGNDSRFTDARAPTGAAGGVLSGTYPNPAFDAAYAAASTTPTVVASVTGAAGTSTNYARADHAHAVTYGSTAGTVAQGNDSRFTDARAPIGAAGGVLSGTYPNPSFDAAYVAASTTPTVVASVTGAVGTSTNYARADHAHAVTYGTTANTVAQGNDSRFVAASSVVPAAVAAATGVVGTGANFAREDHVHPVTFAVVSTVLGTANTSVGVNNQKLVNLLDPTAAQDAATKAYVDATQQGLDLKNSARLGTIAVLPANTAAGTGVTKTLTANANGTLTVDGVLAALNDRVLVMNEASQANNGIYFVSAAGSGAAPWVLTRATDANSSVKVTPGMYVFVEEGTQGGNGYVLTTIAPITLDTTGLSFTQFSGAGQISAGSGMTKSGNTLNVIAHADGSILANADSIQVGVISDAQHGTRGGGTTHSAATVAVAGFMSAADKTKLDGIAATDVALVHIAGTETITGSKTFSSPVGAAVVQNINGAANTDVAVKVGTTLADAGIHASAKLFSVQTSISGSGIDKFWVDKAGDFHSAGRFAGASTGNGFVTVDDSTGTQLSYGAQFLRLTAAGASHSSSGSYLNAYTTTGESRSSAADGATAVAHEIGTTVAWANAGAKLLRVSTAGVEKFSVNPLGTVTSAGNIISGLGVSSINGAVVLGFNGIGVYASSCPVRMSGGWGIPNSAGGEAIQLNTGTVFTDPASMALTLRNSATYGSGPILFSVSGTGKISSLGDFDFGNSSFWLAGGVLHYGVSILGGTNNTLTTGANGHINMGAAARLNASDGGILGPAAASLLVVSPLGGTASDICVRIGSTVATAAFTTTSDIVRFATGIGGTETLHAYMRKGDPGISGQGTRLFLGGGFVIGDDSTARIYLDPLGSGAVVLTGRSGVSSTAVGAWSRMDRAQPDDSTIHKFENSTTKAAITGSGRLDQSGTDSSATPGAATINKPTGISAIASGASSVTITNSLATATCRPMLTWLGDHGAARSWVTRAAGSFTVNLSANASAATSFSWEIANLL